MFCGNTPSTSNLYFCAFKMSKGCCAVISKDVLSLNEVNCLSAFDCKARRQRSRPGSKKKTLPLPQTPEEMYRLTCRYSFHLLRHERTRSHSHSEWQIILYVPPNRLQLFSCCCRQPDLGHWQMFIVVYLVSAGNPPQLFIWKICSDEWDALSLMCSINKGTECAIKKSRKP